MPAQVNYFVVIIFYICFVKFDKSVEYVDLENNNEMKKATHFYLKSGTCEEKSINTVIFRN